MANARQPRRPAAGTDTLRPYRGKRDFSRTPEPAGGPPGAALAGAPLSFVIQKHAASRLHYDLRLELDGVMLSWAVPKGPSYDPSQRRMAIQVEPHPIDYNTFEGTIPAGQYGAGTVIVWDRGHWVPVGDPHAGLAQGKLVFDLHGEKMAGRWELVRIARPGDRQVGWLLFKKRDAFARDTAQYDVVSALPDSVVARPVPAALRPSSWASPAPATGRTSDGAPPADPVDPATLPGAVVAALPAKLAPQLAAPASTLPGRGRWLFEIKFDGYRLMARIEHGQARLFTRGGHDWTARMPALAAALAALPVASAWIDGEIVVPGADGTPDFGALQNAFDRQASDDIVFFVFDLPFCAGLDLRAVPLAERRRCLRSLVGRHVGGCLRFSESFDADGAHLLESARRLGLEGVIAKRADARYVSGRSSSWLKLKTLLREEFVIGGYTDRGADPQAAEVGSLLLGARDEAGELVFAGAVGTGWDAAGAAALKRRLAGLRTDASPFVGDSATRVGRWRRRPAGVERWVRPELVAQVAFRGWTADGQLRHAVFQGLREDKPARTVRLQRSAPAAAGAAASASASASASAPVRVTHPQRVIDASTGATKLDLVRYYESVADWLLPHLAGRPCSLVRGPRGIGGELFFQKHPETLAIPEVRVLDTALWPGHQPLMEIASRRAIVAAAQMNTIEFHTWNASVAAIDQPDRVVFDLDPGEGVDWPRVQDAARLVQAVLDELGLESWLKTSGGNGLHVFVPIVPDGDWDSVKALSRAVVEHVARVLPARFVARSGAANRVGRVFVDYLRNGFGATTVAAYSARARPGLGVSMPVPWSMLDDLRSGAHFTVATAREHLSFHPDDPWAGYWRKRQTLGRAREALGLAT